MLHSYYSMVCLSQSDNNKSEPIIGLQIFGLMSEKYIQKFILLYNINCSVKWLVKLIYLIAS